MTYNVAHMRQEMGSLVQVMMAKSAAYKAREELLTEQYGHDPVLLQMRLDNDWLLNKLSNGSKTCAALITALAAAISAEIAFFEHHRRGG